MRDIDVAIVGAGAAGIAAGRRLTELGKKVLLIEALPRLGGRANTQMLNGLPLDMGAHWLHSGERNPLTALAEEAGEIVDRNLAAWGRQWRDLGAIPQVQHDAWSAYEDFVERLHAAPPASDCAVDAIPPASPWRGFIDGLSSFVNGVETNRLSAADFMKYDDAASENDWRLPGGYGAFIARLGAMLPAKLQTRVSAISHDDDIVLETNDGPIRAKAAIVTVSTAILAKGAIRFNPALNDHLQAAAQLPLGLADKVFLSLSRPEALEPETHLLGSFARAGVGSYYIRPLGRPVIECFLGGRNALALEEAGPDATAHFCMNELRDLLGADLASTLSPLAATAWAHEPHILGSYSHAAPGQQNARNILARPASERLCFAGEACSEQDYSTVHGAWRSGQEAADWIACNL